MKKRTLALILSAAMCLSVALSGCTADEPSQSASTPAPGGETSAPAEEGGKSLTIAVLNDVISLDPAAKDSSSEMQMARLCGAQSGFSRLPLIDPAKWGILFA